jgi:hypothetical protein
MTRELHPAPSKPVKSSRVQHREARLKVALKANMGKRKAHARAKTGAGPAGETTAGETSADNDNE